MFGSFARGIAMCIAIGLAAAGSAGAAQRTFVRTTGIDSNPCSLAAPCRTFGAALVFTDFGGEIVVLDSGGYGTVVIDKPVSIVVPDGIYAGISVTPAVPDGVVVNVASGGIVALRGLTINNQGGTNAVRFQQGDQLLLDNVRIAGFVSAGNGSGIRHESTKPYSTLFLRRVSVRNGDAGLRVDGTTTGKAVTIEHSSFESLGVNCITLTDNVDMTVRDTTVSDCGTGFALTQNSLGGMASLAMERVTITRTFTAAVQSTSNLTSNGPAVSIRDSAIQRTGGVKIVNAADITIARSTIRDCGPATCVDASGGFGYVEVKISDSQIMRGGAGGIRISMDGAAGGIVKMANSQVTGFYSGEGIYLRSAGFVAQLLAQGSTINQNNHGIVLDTHGEARLMGNQVIFNAMGGLVKMPLATGTFFESIGTNQVTSNGWQPGALPEEVPGVFPPR